MPCICDQCIEHCRTLDLVDGPASKDAIHIAFREAAKRWHPDRFESEPSIKPLAEEYFKHVQVAYRELMEHYTDGDEFSQHSSPERPGAAHTSAASISFGNAARCFTAPDFSPYAEEVIAKCMRSFDSALAIVDLSSAEAVGGFSEFILFTGHGVFVRDQHRIVSLMWYSDLGEIRLMDQRIHGKLSFLQRLAERVSGERQSYLLQIYRLDGTLFYSISDRADDSVKKVIYNFLLRKKHQTQP
jgi:curved DNA-binding protein CbpA